MTEKSPTGESTADGGSVWRNEAGDEGGATKGKSV